MILYCASAMSIGNLWSVYNQIKKFCLKSRHLNYRKIILGRNQFQVGASCLVVVGAKKNKKISVEAKFPFTEIFYYAASCLFRKNLLFFCAA